MFQTPISVQWLNKGPRLWGSLLRNYFQLLFSSFGPEFPFAIFSSKHSVCLHSWKWKAGFTHVLNRQNYSFTFLIFRILSRAQRCNTPDWMLTCKSIQFLTCSYPAVECKLPFRDVQRWVQHYSKSNIYRSCVIHNNQIVYMNGFFHSTVKKYVQNFSRQRLGKHIITCNSGKCISVDEYYSSLLGNSQRAN
jgi:hypothetical protein